ncbi:hypothetical protein DS901_00255 [Loktanella sp. D2R18]|uniref:hypothetical protein n=1 Tax=Rhodobacterales TaxID=204455 RepID=UPI000DEA6051|nr:MULTISPECIES: hypothetical protein [Rhodobacterales]MDO6592002.1 hypothetical protein [Yoonia sp. 1_MG-2023]RBW46183.1 hypothetical protein DS901_00255 [Loktanella sp. D2R18]
MKALPIFCALLSTATPTFARDVGDTSVNLGVSTFGVNLEAAYQINPAIRVRGALMGGISLDYDENNDDGDFSGTFDLGGAAFLGDYYPGQSGWRISGGLFFSNTELSLTGTTDIDGLGSQSVTATAEFENKIAPMLSTGYDLAFGRGWSFNSEIGVIFNGGIDLNIIADNSAIQQDVDDDTDVQDAKGDADDITVLPYIGVSLGYRF